MGTTEVFPDIVFVDINELMYFAIIIEWDILGCVQEQITFLFQHIND